MTNRHSEVPDSHVVCVAEQFCHAAELLLRNIPQFAGATAIRCNAALAIELFIKSLDSSWIEHDLSDEIGIDGFAITTKPNTRGHALDVLFGALPLEMQNFLNNAFRLHSLGTKYANLQSVLSVYRTTFVDERYSFENQLDSTLRPLAEIVLLACFFRDTVGQLPVVRR